MMGSGWVFVEMRIYPDHIHCLPVSVRHGPDPHDRHTPNSQNNGDLGRALKAADGRKWGCHRPIHLH